MLFRYPGGKGREASRIIEKVREVNGGAFPDVYAEPFVGGGSVALAFAERNKSTPLFSEKATLHLNDSDWWIASFWLVVSGRHEAAYQYLRRKVLKPIDIEVFRARREKYKPQDWPRKHCGRVEAAYNALFFNRTTFSGILSSGPIGGGLKKGARNSMEYPVNCRWNPERLLKELDTARGLLRGRTTVYCEDWAVFLSRVPANAFLYLDPPYFKAGSALYPQPWNIETHTALRDRLSTQPEHWLLSYDENEEIRKLYGGRHFVLEAKKHYRSMGNHGQENARLPRPNDASELLIYSQ